MQRLLPTSTVGEHENGLFLGRVLVGECDFLQLTKR
jgi:hypothetical protein